MQILYKIELTKYKMTYIIAGRLKDSTFMMADSIMTNSGTHKKAFINKVVKLESSFNTFYSFTGVQFIDVCVKAYDYWLASKSRDNDFVNGSNSIKELQFVISKMAASFAGNEKMKLDIARLFFLDQGNVAFYDLKFDNQNKLISDAQKTILSTNFFVDSVVDNEEQELNVVGQLENYCTNYLKYLSRGEVDFKNRFAFVQLFNDGRTIFKDHFKTFSDLIAMYNEIDYNMIDDPNFLWDI